MSRTKLVTRHILPVHNQWTLIIFAAIFLPSVYWISLNPSKIVDNLGKLLTPLLLINGRSIRIIAVIFNPESALSAPKDKYIHILSFSGEVWKAILQWTLLLR